MQFKNKGVVQATLTVIDHNKPEPEPQTPTTKPEESKVTDEEAKGEK